MTDQSMACAARRAARYWSAAGAPVFVFSFDHVHQGIWHEGCVYGDSFVQPSQQVDPGSNITADTCAACKSTSNHLPLRVYAYRICSKLRYDLTGCL